MKIKTSFGTYFLTKKGLELDSKTTWSFPIMLKAEDLQIGEFDDVIQQLVNQLQQANDEIERLKESLSKIPQVIQDTHNIQLQQAQKRIEELETEKQLYINETEK